MWCCLLGVPAQCAKCGTKLSLFSVSGRFIVLLFPSGIQKDLWYLLHIFVSETGEKNHLAVPPQELHTK